MESFMVAREFINYYKKSKIPAILYKVDFTKAFDSVSWGFLINLMVERGFPPMWINWIISLLKSSSSSLRINGMKSPGFMHTKGLRQGDPLSPLLFILVVDALQAFIRNTSTMLEGPVILAPKALQFADDTIILTEAHPKNLRVLAEVLMNFAKLTGLHLNDQKSVFVPIALPTEAIGTVQSILRCAHKEFPMTYLGLPLSIKKPRKVHFLPLIQSMQTRLQGWQAKYLSNAGRLVLVKSILTALPTHFMQVLKLPKWCYNQMERIRRSFLWKGNEVCSGGHCLVSWEKCCLPKKNGGVGIHHLSTQNDALLIKWLWKLRREPNSVWTETVQTLYGTTDIEDLSSTTRPSYGLKDILHLQPFFNCSIRREGQDPTITWRWTSDGNYSARSAYAKMRDPGVLSDFHDRLWKIKAPPKVKFFLWLALIDKLLTQENLEKRGWPTTNHCMLCSLEAKETLAHLFLQCPFAVSIWQAIFTGSSRRRNRESLQSLWLQISKENTGVSDSKWAASMWNIWKARNNKIFQGKTPNTSQIIERIVHDANLWTTYG